MNFKLHPEASTEIQEAVIWYEEQQSGLGKRFASEAETTIYRIAHFPEINSEMVKNIRRAIVPGFPYGIIYSTGKDLVEVYAVAHLHRRPFYWKSRTK